MVNRIVNRYEGDFPRINKNNSIAVDGMLFYVKKIGNLFVAYEFKSKIRIKGNFDKDMLFDWLRANIVEIKRRINGIKRDD